MIWKLIPAASLSSMPWKNGGGTTREALKFPPSSTIDTFDWRISLADVATSGPFSIFPDVDRTLLITAGKGIELDGNTLTPSAEPFSFAGEFPYSASLIDGPVADFNVMTRRTRYTHAVRRHRAAGTSVGRNAVRVIVALSARATCTVGKETVVLARLDHLLIEGPEGVAVVSTDWLEVEFMKQPTTLT